MEANTLQGQVGPDLEDLAESDALRDVCCTPLQCATSVLSRNLLRMVHHQEVGLPLFLLQPEPKVVPHGVDEAYSEFGFRLVRGHRPRCSSSRFHQKRQLIVVSTAELGGVRNWLPQLVGEEICQIRNRLAFETNMR